jgi:hypothetical protein
LFTTFAIIIGLILLFVAGVLIGAGLASTLAVNRGFILNGRELFLVKKSEKFYAETFDEASETIIAAMRRGDFDGEIERAIQRNNKRKGIS